MNKMIAIALLGTTLTTQAFAAASSGNVGINVSFDNAVGIQGEFNIQKPLSLQVFLKNYSRSYLYGGPGGSYNYSYTAIGVAGIYDFSRELRVANKKFILMQDSVCLQSAQPLAARGLTLIHPFSAGFISPLEHAMKSLPISTWMATTTILAA
jgi:hypothetical protein